MKLLVSVRNVGEAMIAARAGADFIDLKEPSRGALGALDVAQVGRIVGALRQRRISLPVSATIGDYPAAAREAIAAQVDAVGACGVDYVKVGIEPEPGAPSVARDLLAMLAAAVPAIVPVFIADRGLDLSLVAAACSMGFPGVMVDTAENRGGSVLERVDPAALRRFVDTVRGAGRLAGVAGALRRADLPALLALAPDFAGFRSALCLGDRAQALQGGLVRSLAHALAGALAGAGGASMGAAAAGAASAPTARGPAAAGRDEACAGLSAGGPISGNARPPGLTTPC